MLTKLKFLQSRLQPMTQLSNNPMMNAQPTQHMMATPYQMNMLYNYQMRFIMRRQGRINKRLRKYRQDKILKESSFNKNEGKGFKCHIGY